LKLQNKTIDEENKRSPEFASRFTKRNIFPQNFLVLFCEFKQPQINLQKKKQILKEKK